jgi:hypothetical protein
LTFDLLDRQNPIWALQNEAPKKRFFKVFFSAKVMKGDGPERKTISM